jgi:hypothetical protein
LNGAGPAAFAAVFGLASLPVAAAPLAVEPGKSVLLICQTQSVVVAPEAASSKGEIRIRLEGKVASGTALIGSWSALEVGASHAASFIGRHKGECVAGCELALDKGSSLQLWAPKRAAPTSLAAGAPLTIAVIDAETLKLRASTFIDNAIAALEQGTCERAAD